MDDSVISGGHFGFYIFVGNRWSDVVVPAIFEISTLKNPLVQIFMLLSRCAHIKQKMAHIRPTICYVTIIRIHFSVITAARKYVITGVC